MDTLRQDLKFAFRMLGKDRGFAVTAILTLALCIGANTAIFTVVQSVLLRPLPFPESGRLVFAYDSFPGAGVDRAGTSVPNYFDRLALTDVFDSQALYQCSGYRVGQGTSAEGVSAMNVTPSFFHVLRAAPVSRTALHGSRRDAGPRQGRPGELCVRSKQPGGIDGIVGRDLRLNDRAYRVVGVLPESFAFLSPEVKSSSRSPSPTRTKRKNSATARITRPSAAWRRCDDPAGAGAVRCVERPRLERAGPLKSALRTRNTTRSSARSMPTSFATCAAPSSCCGVACCSCCSSPRSTSPISRWCARAADQGARDATRARRGALPRRTATGHRDHARSRYSAAGPAWRRLSGASTRCRRAACADLPRAHEIHMDGVVIAFTLGISVLLGLVVGAVPALQVAGVNLNSVLREDGRTGTASRGARYVRRGLVVAQVALAFVLLIGAGLLLASFRQLLGVDPGFRAEHVITGRVSPLETHYPDDAALRSYVTRALDRVRVLPGVEAAGVTSFLPFSWDGNSSVIIPRDTSCRPASRLSRQTGCTLPTAISRPCGCH